jgi:hypothetical protein
MNSFKTNGYVIFFLLMLTSCSGRIPDASVQLNSHASIYPDYVNTTIPWNIAPMNFLILDDADDYVTLFYNNNGSTVTSNGPKVQVKLRAWENLLKKSRGDTLFIDIYCKRNQQWFKYRSINNLVAKEQIDDYIPYRLWLLIWNRTGSKRIFPLPAFAEGLMLSTCWYTAVPTMCESR